MPLGLKHYSFFLKCLKSFQKKLTTTGFPVIDLAIVFQLDVQQQNGISRYGAIYRGPVIRIVCRSPSNILRYEHGTIVDDTKPFGEEIDDLEALITECKPVETASFLRSSISHLESDLR